MNGTAGFLIAVGGVSAIIYWLMSRAENRAARRSSTSDGGSGYSYDSGSSIGGWSLTNWFSSSNSSSDSSSTSGSSGSWDSDSSGGGCDSGGGGGDSGGGGD